MSEYKDEAAIFKALSDPQRLRILELLRSGQKCACRLLEDLDINQSSLSYHMKILTASSIVSASPNGKWTYYSIDEEGSAAAIALLASITQTNTEAAGVSCCTTA